MTALTFEDNSEADRIVVNFTRSAHDDLLVKSVEIMTGDMRNRYSFRGGRAVANVFQQDLADLMNSAIAKMSDGDRLLSLPDFLYSIPGLVLSGMRVLTSPMEDGGDAVMVRFKYYVGAIKQIFRFEPSMMISSPTVRERIAVDVLHDIVSPIFDLLSLSQSTSRALLADHAEAVGRRLDRLDQQMEELKFYSGLLQRYVAGCQHDAAQGKLADMAEDAPPRLEAANGTHVANGTVIRHGKAS